MTTKLDHEIVDQIVKEQDNPIYHNLDSFYGTDENSHLPKDVVKSKYFAPWEESLFDMWVRLAWGAAQAEPEDKRIYWANKFFGILRDFKFLPGGRINYGLGREDIRVSFSNCYVIPIKEDSLDSIYDCVKESALTYKVGGGVGIDPSILRPKNAPIQGTAGKSCGGVGFLELYSTSTNTVSQQNRRGALMISMLVSHPDIESFINIKNDVDKESKLLEEMSLKYPNDAESFDVLRNKIQSKRAVQHANISVKLTDEFLNCVETNSDFDLVWNNTVYKTVNAKELWDKIVYNAWASAEPGLLFWDRMIENNNLEYVNPLLGVNPCAELPLGAYGNCLLGHVNLPKFINDDGKFDSIEFENTIRVAMRFLDDIVSLNDGRHALEKQNETARGERRTGLGITGLGDFLIALGLEYGSKESINFIESVMGLFRDTAYDSSCEIAKEKGAFPWFDPEMFFKSSFAKNLPEFIKEKIKNTGIRNGMLLTCAPVGSGSIIAETSSGIEPIFRTSFTRRVKQDDGVNFTEYKVLHPAVAKLFGDEELPSYVVDSSQISPENRIKMQSCIQKYIDNSISSTVNLPNSATVEDVGKIYLLAWKMGCKGVTVYREGCREGILISDEVKQSNKSNAVIFETRSAMKRPLVLSGETYKKKIDITNKRPYNCYITVNFEPNTRTPYELFVVETNSDKDIKDMMMLETTTRLVSLLLRHHVPLKFIISQLEGIKSQYIYSLPISIAGVLKNYLPNNGELEQCPKCHEFAVQRENGCYLCTACGYSKCQ